MYQPKGPIKGWQYICKRCGYERDGLLPDAESSWTCPQCNAGDCGCRTTTAIPVQLTCPKPWPNVGGLGG